MKNSLLTGRRNSFLLCKRLLLLFLMVSTFPAGAKVYSQNPPLNITVNDLPVRDALRVIEQESGMRFFMSDDLPAMDAIVNLSVNDMAFEDVMKQVLDGNGLAYQLIEDNLVVITARNAPKQDSSVSGQVTDKYGDPLPGVNIVVKGTTTGTITDVNGNFNIQVPDLNVVLQLSYIGFTAIEVRVNGQRSLQITMDEDLLDLDEVVIVGYGTQRKVTITGSVAKVDGQELSKINVANTSKALQGVTPGITVIDRGGAPGGDDPDIFIRGVGTTGSSSPLVLVDGIEMGLSSIPSHEIESISILKDASSASIYGSRAAHGVILVTTKRGKTGKMKVTYDGYIGIQDRAIKPKAVGAREYMEMVNESSKNAGNNPIFSEQDITTTENGSSPFTHPYINYMDEVYNATYQTGHNVGISGGNETGRYLMSFDYLKQPGLMDNVSYDRFNYRLNTDVQVGSRLAVSADLLYRHDDRLWPQRLDDAQRSVMSMVPTVPVRHENGNYTLDNQNDNPVASLDLNTVGEDRRVRDEFYGQVKATLDLIDGLSITGVAALNGAWERKKIHSKNQKFYDANDEYVMEWHAMNGVKDERNNSHQLTLRFLANYNKKFNQDHDLSVLYGMEQISFRGHYSMAERRNLISDGVPEVTYGNASNQYAAGYPTMWGINSFFGRINYGFRDRYLFEANIRTDGSSRFAKGNQWGVFPSVSAAWRISEESFMEDLYWLNGLKIRASWGRTGNERIVDPADTNKQIYFGYLPQYGVENMVMNGSLVTAVRQSQMANPLVTWETGESTNVGVDFVLFNNSIYGEIDYYNRDTRDILLNLAIPKFIGLDPPPQNSGVVRNSGVEALLGYRKTDGSFRFNTSVNFSYNKNRWIDRGGDDDSIDSWYIEKEGYSLNSFYIFEADGLIANDAELAEYKAKFKEDPRGIESLKAGDVKFVDVNGDGTIDNDDRVVRTPNIPKFLLGLNFSADYRNFDLSLFFQSAFGSHRYLYGEWYEGPSYEAFTGLHFRDRWTTENENPNASVPRLEAATNRNASSYNTFYLKKNNYLRLKNIQLGYTIPRKTVNTIGLEKIRVYVAATNLFTITGLDQGLDPESKNGRLNQFPITKTMSFGVNVVF